MTQNYETLRDTWIYQEIAQEIQKQAQSQRIQDHRHILITIVEARFPRLKLLAEQAALAVEEIEPLLRCIRDVSTARLTKEARQVLSEVCRQASDRMVE